VAKSCVTLNTPEELDPLLIVANSISEEIVDGDHICESIDTVSIGRGSVVRTIRGQSPKRSLFRRVSPEPGKTPSRQLG